jgi:formylglycine-generating enzyme required for sulfatase activity
VGDLILVAGASAAVAVGAAILVFLAVADDGLGRGSRVSPTRDRGAVDLAWCEILRADPDPQLVTDPRLRDALAATGLPWHVRDVSSGIELMLVPPGRYPVGADLEDALRGDDEGPRRMATVTAPYYLGRFEVTNAQLREFDPFHVPDLGIDDLAAWERLPVTRTSWHMAAAFCEAHGFGFPSELRWEVACRGHATGRFPWGNDPRARDGELNAADGAGRRLSALFSGAFAGDDGFAGPAPVGSFRAGPFGHHDLLGNAAEWCADPWEVAASEQVQDAGIPRAIRGGSHDEGVRGCRITARRGSPPGARAAGFRVHRDPGAPPPTRPSRVRRELDAAVGRAVLWIRDHYGVEVVNGPLGAENSRWWSRVRGEGPERERLCRRALELRPLLERYPTEFLVAGGVSRIVLVSELAHAALGACYGVADTGNDALWLDVNLPEREHRDFEAVFHHEVFHFVDGADGRTAFDKPWRQLNGPEMRYRPFTWYRLEEGHHPGFVSAYSTRTPAEDKSEIFTWLMIRPDDLAAKAAADPVIAAKVDAIKKMVREFNPAFADREWGPPPDDTGGERGR